MTRKITATFIDLCLRGEASSDEIGGWIAKWNGARQEIELHEYLGMTWTEYSSWTRTPEILPVIIAARKNNRNFKQLIAEFQALPIAAGADAKTKANRLAAWLKDHNTL
jgi:hypothetical protein